MDLCLYFPALLLVAELKSPNGNFDRETSAINYRSHKLFRTLIGYTNLRFNVDEESPALYLWLPCYTSIYFVAFFEVVGECFKLLLTGNRLKVNKNGANL